MKPRPKTKTTAEVNIRPAILPDVDNMKALIERAAAAGRMLPRTAAELCASIRDFIVAVDGRRVVGCVSLHVFTRDLAEIRSLVVDDDHQGSGIGRDLVTRSLEEARSLGATRVFALTYVPGFFEKCGFRRLEDKAELPHKVWTECIRCPHFPDCQEEAFIIEL